MQLTLRFTLASDAAFGRGDGVAGLLDTEVQHDPFTGLPLLKGRTLKGLLVEACADLLYTITPLKDGKVVANDASAWHKAAACLFGKPGSQLAHRAHLRVGDARFPAALREAVAYEVDTEAMSAAEVLEACTTIRRQTAMDAKTGSAKTGSLRAIRAILRETTFESTLELDLSDLDPALHDHARGLLAACVHALHRAGLRRNRGMGRLKGVALLEGETNVGNGWLDLYQSLHHQQAEVTA